VLELKAQVDVGGDDPPPLLEGIAKRRRVARFVELEFGRDAKHSVERFGGPSAVSHGQPRAGEQQQGRDPRLAADPSAQAVHPRDELVE
jgi:hypothetical protein